MPSLFKVSPLLAGTAILLLLCGLSPAYAADLIAGRDWQHFSGAAVTDTGIVITPLGRVIVPKISLPAESPDAETAEKADDPPVPNPPINLRGPRLQVTGDFSVSAVLDVPSGRGAYLYLYGTLPVIYDEWRQEGKVLSLGLKNGALVVSAWNGFSPRRRREKERISPTWRAP